MNSIAYQPSYQFHTQPQTINNVNDVTPPVLTDPKYYNNFPKYSVNNSLYNCNQTFGYQVQMPSVNSIVYPTQNKNTFRSTTSRVGKKRKRNNGRFSNSKNNRIKPPKKRPRKNPNNIVGIPSYQQNVNGKVPPTLLPPVGSQPSTKPPPVANYHPYFSHNSNAYHDVQNNVCNYSYSQPSCYLPYQNNVCNHHSYSHFESPNYVYSPSIRNVSPLETDNHQLKENKEKQITDSKTCLVNSIHQGYQCSSCGARLSTERLLDQHMNNHFEKNSKEHNKKQICSRDWLSNVDDWINGKTGNTIQNTTNAMFGVTEKTPEDSNLNPSTEQDFVIQDDEHENCAICGEALDVSFDQELEEWTFIHAKKLLDSSIVHTHCL